MNRPLKIYLGDLTYDTIALSTEVFPINVGYVGAYCQKRFGSDVDIRLFKYIEDLDETLNNEPPDLLGLSNYSWNQRVGVEMFRMLHGLNPEAVSVWGGPNFPFDVPTQQWFMETQPEVDAYVPVEGEIGFAHLVERMLGRDSLAGIKDDIRSRAIDGCVTRHPDGSIQYPVAVPRFGELDEIPSPYLAGLMDRFFDGRLVPMIQTNRGCPFTCSFCVDGSPLVKKVNYFSLDRVREELDYIGARVPSSTHGMEISDLNFGMYKRDLEICDMLRDIQDRYNWPKHIVAPTGKNRKERIIEAIGRLNGALRLTMSVQSTDPDVLSNVKRDNISTEAMVSLAPKIKEAGLRTTSELILPLPGETYETHLQSIRDLVEANIDFIKGHTLILLFGSEMATPEERSKWGFQTKWRPLTMDFVELSNGRRVIEVEEVAIGSSTLSFDEYVDLRVLAFALWVTTRGVAYDPLLKLLRQRGVDIVDLFLRVKEAAGAPAEVARVLNDFRQSTIGELWDSAEEIAEHFRDDEAYARLLNGEEGINLLNFYNGLVTSEHMEAWTDHTLAVARDLLLKAEPDPAALVEFEEIATYCRGLTFNTMRQDRMAQNPEAEFRFDLERFIADESGKTLSEFALESPRRVEFRLSQEQYKVLEDLLQMHGNTTAGRGQALKYVPLNMLWRQPVAVA